MSKKNPQSETTFYRWVNLLGSIVIFLLLTWSIGIFTVDWKFTNDFYFRGGVLSLFALALNFTYFRYYDFDRHYPTDDKNDWKSSKLFRYNRGKQNGVYEIFQIILYAAIVVVQIYFSASLFRGI